MGAAETGAAEIGELDAGAAETGDFVGSGLPRSANGAVVGQTQSQPSGSGDAVGTTTVTGKVGAAVMARDGLGDG